MKKRFGLNVILLVAVIVLSYFVPSASTEKAVAQESPYRYQQSRFTSMLNRNFVYGEDFDNLEIIKDNSILAQLNLSEDGEFISKQLVDGFVWDMYGVKIGETTANQDLPSKDGFYYIVPRGYSTYSHEITNITENEDGSFNVESAVTINAHDGEPETATATSLFVKNETSAFGYNIIYCNIA